jgi:hypothetical protein
MTLTIKRIAKLRQQPGKYLDEHGLILKVFSPNSASWFLRYQRKGRERYLGLGPLSAFTLAEARERARRARALLADGVDPLEKKRAATARNVTFAACAQAYYAAHHAQLVERQICSAVYDHVTHLCLSASRRATRGRD